MSTQIPIDLVKECIAIYRQEGDDFVFVDLNRAAEALEQVDRASLIGKRLTETFPGIRKFGLFDVLCRVSETGRDEVLETSFYEDERISGWRYNSVYRLEDGTLLVQYEDRNESMSIEKDLNALGDIIDSTLNEIYIFDRDSLLFTYINDGASQNIGYSFEEMREMTPVDIKPEYTVSDFRRQIAPLLDGTQKQLFFETVHRRKDGSDYNVEIRLQLINRDGSGRFVVIANDITQRKKIEAALRQSEEQFRTITESAMVGICIYQEHIIYSNQAYRDISGFSQAEIETMHIWDVAVNAEDMDMIESIAKRRLQGERFPQVYNDFHFRTRDGTNKIVRALTQTIRYGDGYAGLVSVMDISDLTEMKRKLDLFARVVEQTDDLIKITDREGHIIYVNDALVAKSGYTRSELLGATPSRFKSGAHDAAFYAKLHETIDAGEVFRDTLTNRRKDGSIYYEEQTITPIMDEQGQVRYFVASGKDVSERIMMERELERRATIDMLTGIYNRDEANRQLDRTIEGFSRYGGSMAMMMIDLDHFKEVNDRFGHDAGDEVLQTFSRIVSMQIRQSDIFARWGGEEFIVVAAYNDVETLVRFAQKLRTVVENFEFPHVGSMTISVGVTVIGLGDTKQSLLRRVDQALYASKSGGRNQVTFLPAEETEAPEV